MAETFDQNYLDLQNKIKLMLAKKFEQKQLSKEELLAILYILGQTNTEPELQAFIEIFAESFSVLKELIENKEQKTKTHLEDKIKQIVSEMIKTDPLKATEIAKKALEPGMTFETLKKLYPEIKDE